MSQASTVALIGAGSAIIVAVVSAIFARAAAERAAEAQGAITLAQEREKARLIDDNSEAAARRGYRFDALKRLYAEVEPLMFQLGAPLRTNWEHALNMALASRNGHLGPGGENWLAGGYYLKVTMHRLLSPVAIQTLMERRLSQIDLSLEPRTAAVYVLLTEYAAVWRKDFELAGPVYGHGYVPMDGDRAKAADGRDARQGIYSGNRDAMADALIIEPTPPETLPRAMRFGAFDRKLIGDKEDDKEVQKAFKPLSDILVRFTPEGRPVFWGLVIAASGLAVIIERVLDGGADPDLAAAMRAADDPARWEALTTAAGPVTPVVRAFARDIWTSALKKVGDHRAVVQAPGAAAVTSRSTINHG